MTFHLVCVGWVFFRAQPTVGASGIANAWAHLTGLAGLALAPPQAPPLALVAVAIPFLFDLLQRWSGDSLWTRNAPWALRGAVLGVIVFLAALIGSETPRTFVYFQF